MLVHPLPQYAKRLAGLRYPYSQSSHLGPLLIRLTCAALPSHKPWTRPPGLLPLAQALHLSLNTVVGKIASQKLMGPSAAAFEGVTVLMPCEDTFREKLR